MRFNRPLASTIIWNSRQHPVNIGWLRKRYLVIILYLLVSQIISLANSSLQQHAIYDILPFLACIPNCVNLNFKGWWPRLTPEPCWDWSLLELGGIGWNSWKYSKVHNILIILRRRVVVAEKRERAKSSDDKNDNQVDQSKVLYVYIYLSPPGKALIWASEYCRPSWWSIHMITFVIKLMTNRITILIKLMSNVDRDHV